MVRLGLRKVTPGLTTYYSQYWLVAIPRGPHPIPFRIRKLSPSGPMVLIPQGIGRVGRCQPFSFPLPPPAFGCNCAGWPPSSDRCGSRTSSTRRLAISRLGCSWRNFASKPVAGGEKLMICSSVRSLGGHSAAVFVSESDTVN